MPNFVDPFDVSTPLGTDPRSEGDDRIRELKRAFLERYEIEHDFPAAAGAGSGRHKFGFGTTATRDAIPTADLVAGAIWFNTTRNVIEQWDGSSWQERNFNRDQTLSSVTPTVLTTSNQLVVPIAVFTTGRYLVNSRFNLTTVDPGNSNGVILDLDLNGSLVQNLWQHTQVQPAGTVTEIGGSSTIQNLVGGNTLSVRARKGAATGTVTLTSVQLQIIRLGP